MSPSPFPSTLRTPAPAGRQPPAVRAASALLMDLDTGQVLFALNATDKRPIASLTKIMTAYLVMSRTSPTDVVTVSDDAASGRVVGISSLGLEAGERIREQQLLYALLLQSANDAAVALAEHVSGTVDAFVATMNRTAARLGMARTEFASPNGLDDTGYSTARDLARVTRAAYSVPGFGSIVATRFHSIPAPEDRPRLFAPSDEDAALLLGDYLYAHGLVRIAELGRVEAVQELAELISRCAHLRAESEPGDGEAWAETARRLDGDGDEVTRELALAAHARRVG